MSNQANRAALFGNKGAASTAAKPASVTTQKPSSGSSSPPVTASEPSKPVSKTLGMKSSSGTTSIGLSAEAKRKKNEEATQLLERANNALKTSLFQWSPDYLVAAPLFEQAADIYKQLGETHKAIEYYQKSAEGNEKQKAMASAALAMNKAATVAIEAGLDTEAPKLLQATAEYWAAHGELSRYGETVHRLAKQLEARAPKKAKEYHWQGLRSLAPDEMPKEQLNGVPALVFDMTRHMLSFFIKQHYFEDAIKLSKRMAEISIAFQLDSSFHKALASETLLTLIHTADVVQAQQLHLSHFSHSDYLSSQECDVADMFIVAVQTQDADKFDEARRHPQLNYLDPQLALILRQQLSLDDLVEGIAPFAPKASTTASSSATTKPPLSSKQPAVADTANAAALFGSQRGAKPAVVESKPVSVVPENATHIDEVQPIVTDLPQTKPSDDKHVEYDHKDDEVDEEDVFDMTGLSVPDEDANHESTSINEEETAKPTSTPSNNTVPASAPEEEDDDLAFLA